MLPATFRQYYYSRELFMLLYDLTSTYFEVNASDLPEGAKRRHGYISDKRPDCPQLVIALVVTPDGLRLAYQVLPRNTADSKTLRTFLSKIETRYGTARRVWVMDRGVPTEAVLAEMRASDPPVQYLVGTPKGRRNRLEKHLIEKPWRKAREGVKVKLLAQDEELYVFAQSADRVGKEHAMRRRQLKWLWARLGKVAFAFAMDCKQTMIVSVFHFSKDMVSDEMATIIPAAPTASSNIPTVMHRIGDCPDRPAGKDL